MSTQTLSSVLWSQNQQCNKVQLIIRRKDSLKPLLGSVSTQPVLSQVQGFKLADKAAPCQVLLLLLLGVETSNI